MGDDHIWLARIRLAFKIYKQQHPDQSQNINQFIAWLYKEYGFVYKDEE